VASSAWACQSGDVVGEQPRAPAGAPARAAPTPNPLEVLELGPLHAGDKGGLLVVLLHGWGARGDDLAPLARALERPRTRFLVPAAPLSRPGGGRAWWQLGASQRPAHASTDELPRNHEPNTEVAAARRAVQALLHDSRQRYAPDSIVIAGFSQGAMLALDVALAADPPVDRAAVLSGALLVDSLPALHEKKATPRAVFVAHGRRDQVLPFASGASIERVLAPYGHQVSFFPFDGGHEIPAAVVARLGEFLFA
jgi:phospholipase/carboxylesterase